MLHTHSKIWIHLIWSTKKRKRCLINECGEQLHLHLIEQAKNELKVPFEELNIQPEHVHALIDLPTNVMLSDFMQGIKGESSHWMNQRKIINT